MLDAKPLSFRDASPDFSAAKRRQIAAYGASRGWNQGKPQRGEKKGSSMEPDPNVRKSQSLRTRRQLHDSLLNRPHH